MVLLSAAAVWGVSFKLMRSLFATLGWVDSLIEVFLIFDIMRSIRFDRVVISDLASVMRSWMSMRLCSLARPSISMRFLEIVACWSLQVLRDSMPRVTMWSSEHVHSFAVTLVASCSRSSLSWSYLTLVRMTASFSFWAFAVGVSVDTLCPEADGVTVECLGRAGVLSHKVVVRALNCAIRRSCLALAV